MSAFISLTVTSARVGTLGGIVSRGFGLNDLGQVVGDSGTSILGEASHAFRTDAALVMTDLGTLGGRYSSARAINNSGRVVGESSFSRDLDNEIHAFRTDAAGAMSDLGTLGGTYSRANAINAAGDAVGFAALAGDEVTHAFLAPAGGGMIDLGTFGGAPRSEATAINDAGQIVGYSFEQRDTGRVPFLYENGRMIDLNTLLPAGSGWTLLEAADINNLGQIVGIGTFGGQQRGFVLTPVPEPAQASLFAGAGVLVLRRRRK